jgi:hypothetical protein
MTIPCMLQGTSLLVHLLGAGKVFVHQFLLFCTLKSDKGPATPCAVNSIGLWEGGVLTGMIAELYRLYHVFLERFAENLSLQYENHARRDDASQYDLHDRMTSSRRSVVSPRHRADPLTHSL